MKINNGVYLIRLNLSMQRWSYKWSNYSVIKEDGGSTNNQICIGEMFAFQQVICVISYEVLENAYDLFFYIGICPAINGVESMPRIRNPSVNSLFRSRDLWQALRSNNGRLRTLDAQIAKLRVGLMSISVNVISIGRWILSLTSEIHPMKIIRNSSSDEENFNYIQDRFLKKI